VTSSGTMSSGMQKGRMLRETASIVTLPMAQPTVPRVGPTGGVTRPMPRLRIMMMMVDFLDAIDDDREPGVNGSEALKVHRLIDALLESGASGRPVRVDAGTP
jgi:predicted dehydrogenase